jgi:putative membrane protein insertion efficiency factor
MHFINSVAEWLSGIVAKIKTPLRHLATLPLKFYKYFISPLLPMACRFTPSCSDYAMEAIQKYGVLKGSWLGLKRIIRCNPWGGHGSDPLI